MSSVSKAWLFPFTGAVVLFGTLWGGWLQGRMVNQRGNNNELLVTPAKHLKQPLSEQHGNWRLLKEMELSDDELQLLQCPAHINRSYVNQQTQDVVTVMVIVGPPGPVSVHTPEVCYGSRDFKAQGDREPVTIVDSQQQKHQLWRVTMESLDSLRVSESVFYGWSTGSAWSAPKDPRWARASEPYLYKIQVAGPLTPASEDFKPCEDFLSWFLPEIQTHLVLTHSDTSTDVSSRK